MKKTITNEEILDLVYDLADAQGLRIDEFVDQLQYDYADAGMPARAAYDPEGLPPEVLAELEQAKTLRREMRDAKRKTEEDAALREEIAAFRELFPSVTAEEIPEEVWEAVANGVGLKYAYALSVLSGRQDGGHAEEVNRETSARSAAAVGEGSTEPSFSPEQVERMSPREVAKNYKNVLRAFKSWR